MQSSRRRFLNTLTFSSALALARSGPSGGIAQFVANGFDAASGAAQEGSFRGRRAGEERDVDGIMMCWCPPGRFVMGSPPAERGHRSDEAQVEVALSKGFWTAKHEVTQGQWKTVAGKFPDRLPSPEFGEGDEFPVYWINFDEAEAFCSALTRRAHRSGALPAIWEFRLPTEAQWEYACRAGTSTATSFGDSLTLQQANFGGESDDRALRLRGGGRRGGSYPANPWGIHDMHGNVWEWC